MSDPVFRRSTNALTLAAVAIASSCELPPGGDPTRVIAGVAALALAGPDELALAADHEAMGELAATRAGACLVPPSLREAVPAGTVALVSDTPFQGFARAAALIDPETRRPSRWPGPLAIHARAFVAADARLEPGVVVAPGAIIGPGAEIGAATTIGANCLIEAGVRVGRGCAIGPNVTVGHALIGDNVVVHAGARIGIIEPGAPRLGRAIVQNAVEIGANAVIARGGLADTVIGEGAVVAPCAFVASDTIVPRLAVVAGPRP